MKESVFEKEFRVKSRSPAVQIRRCCRVRYSSSSVHDTVYVLVYVLCSVLVYVLVYVACSNNVVKLHR